MPNPSESKLIDKINYHDKFLFTIFRYVSKNFGFVDKFNPEKPINIGPTTDFIHPIIDEKKKIDKTYYKLIGSLFVVNPQK